MCHEYLFRCFRSSIIICYIPHIPLRPIGLTLHAGLPTFIATAIRQALLLFQLMQCIIHINLEISIL
jgi:hypothetical protein